MNLFIFRRDLRLIDNKGLDYAMKNFDNIIPIFIFTPEQITTKNKYISNNSIQFMIESLKELDTKLKKYDSKLHIFNGDNISILKKIIKMVNINNIVFNKDYTPYAIARDNNIIDLCQSNNINCIIIEDYLLHPIGKLLKENNEPYTIYTPFKNNGKKYKIDEPNKNKIKNLITENKLTTNDYIKYKTNEHILVNGGRINGIKQLKLLHKQKKYNNNRNNLYINTSLLSAYIKFGCISIREVYHTIYNLFGKNNQLVDQLFWREFYFYIAYYFPRVLKDKNYNTKYNNIKWNDNNNLFKAWCNAQTGYPIIDAAMTELNTIGYMHNRGRLITSNFLNRILGQDWRKGEQYFATQLTDYDPSINNGNWQWIASTGVDPKPYFQRLFNPWLQSKKFDINAEYIKKWLPQLNDIPAKELHEWEKYSINYDLKKINYIKPIVDYKTQRQLSVEMYRDVL